MSPRRAAVTSTSAPAPSPVLAIEYVSLTDIERWPGNPKINDVGSISASVLRFGFRDPVAVNRRNHTLEEGHGRIATLRGLHQQGRPAPEHIQVDADGTWRVPVLFFDDDDVTQHGYALAHNRTQELGGGYDDAALLTALIEQGQAERLEGTGFDGDDLDALRRKLEGPQLGAELDESVADGVHLCHCPTCGHEHHRMERPA